MLSVLEMTRHVCLIPGSFEPKVNHQPQRTVIFLVWKKYEDRKDEKKDYTEHTDRTRSLLFCVVNLLHLQGLCFYPSLDSSIIWKFTALQGYNNIPTPGSLAPGPKEWPSLWWSASHNTEKQLLVPFHNGIYITMPTLLLFLQLPSSFQTPFHGNSHSFLDLQIIWFFWKQISSKPERESRYSNSCHAVSQSLDQLPWYRYQDVK